MQRRGMDEGEVRCGGDRNENSNFFKNTTQRRGLWKSQEETFPWCVA